MRLKLSIGYDGRDFSGWAKQPGLRTVQGVLEEWITKVARLTTPAELTCAGRTDAGVHARGQVAHLDVPDDVDPDTVRRRLQRVLPGDVVVWNMTHAPADFDARFTATWRRYRYRLTDAVVDPLHRGFVVGVRDTLDVESMTVAAQRLLGLRDFAAFCKPRDGATTIRTLHELTVCRSDIITITVQADAFCHSMVRSLVGALCAVGSGRRDVAWIDHLLRCTSRPSDVQVMPAHGLVLEEVGYPADDQLATRDRQSRRRRTAHELLHPQRTFPVPTDPTRTNE